MELGENASNPPKNEISVIDFVFCITLRHITIATRSINPTIATNHNAGKEYTSFIILFSIHINKYAVVAQLTNIIKPKINVVITLLIGL